MLRITRVRKPVSLLLVLSIFMASTLSGCGGQSARTVDRYMPGDEKKSCRTLLAEIAMMDDEIAKKDQKKQGRDFWNVVKFIGGLVIIIPFFFMDTKGSHEIELDALTARRKMLKIYFAENGCSVADPSTSAIIGRDGILLCSQCGSAGKDEWIMKDGKTMCLDCYKKMEDSKKTSKESLRVY